MANAGVVQMEVDLRREIDELNRQRRKVFVHSCFHRFEHSRLWITPKTQRPPPPPSPIHPLTSSISVPPTLKMETLALASSKPVLRLDSPSISTRTLLPLPLRRLSWFSNSRVSVRATSRYGDGMELASVFPLMQRRSFMVRFSLAFPPRLAVAGRLLPSALILKSLSRLPLVNCERPKDEEDLLQEQGVQETRSVQGHTLQERQR